MKNGKQNSSVGYFCRPITPWHNFCIICCTEQSADCTRFVHISCQVVDIIWCQFIQLFVEDHKGLCRNRYCIYCIQYVFNIHYKCRQMSWHLFSLRWDFCNSLWWGLAKNDMRAVLHVSCNAALRKRYRKTIPTGSQDVYFSNDTPAFTLRTYL